MFWSHGRAFRLTVDGKNLEAFLGREYPEVARKLRFLRVDAEGADGTILESLAGLIAETRPFIRAEVFKYLNAEQRVQLYDAVACHGYTVHRLKDLHEYRGPVLQRTDMEASDTFDIFAIHD